MSNQKVVLITGASSGVGQATAGLLARNGYKVFGTSRHPAGAEAISGVEMLSLDVRSDSSVAACAKAVVVTGIVNQNFDPTSTHRTGVEYRGARTACWMALMLTK
jgi:NAD(P)-dependent dehydrogenase (short-subunit alcohol dehydrogenase family)